MTYVAFSIKFAKTNQKFAENSEFCEKNSLFFKIIHFTPQRGLEELAGVGPARLEVRQVHGVVGRHLAEEVEGQRDEQAVLPDLADGGDEEGADLDLARAEGLDRHLS